MGDAAREVVDGDVGRETESAGRGEARGSEGVGVLLPVARSSPSGTSSSSSSSNWTAADEA